MTHDETFWNELSNEIEFNLSNDNFIELNNNINALFCRFDELPSNEAWNLALKVYTKYKNNLTISLNFIMGITTNFNILPNNEEAWILYKEIPTHIDLFFKNDAKYWQISYLQENSDKIPAKKVWNLLKLSSEDIDPKIRGETGYTICEYIGKSNKFPQNAWDIINILLKDPEKMVKQRILSAFSDFYSDLPKEKVWNLTIDLSKEKSKKIRDGCLTVAIEKSKNQVKSKNYLNASNTLDQLLKQSNYCFKFGWTRFIFLGILLFIGLYLVKDTWIYILNNIPYLLAGIILLLLVLWKLLKFKREKYLILFYVVIVALPILLLFPLTYVILNFFISLSPNVYNIIFFGLIPSFIIPFMIINHITISIKLVTRDPKYNLANGLYNYYIGRYYVQKYISSKNSKVRLNFLKHAIKEFKKATDNYNKLLFKFNEELKICPYCLNFYQGIHIYENLLRKPKESSIKDLENKIDMSILVMEETKNGSSRLTQILKELLDITKVLFRLKKERQNIIQYDSVDRIKIDKEIKEKSNEIDEKIEKIDMIISDIEDQNLPLIVEIMREKREELDHINTDIKREGFKGFDKYYAGEEYSLLGILLFIVGLAMSIIGGAYSSVYLLAGLTFSIIGAIILYFAKIKKAI